MHFHEFTDITLQWLLRHSKTPARTWAACSLLRCKLHFNTHQQETDEQIPKFHHPWSCDAILFLSSFFLNIVVTTYCKWSCFIHQLVCLRVLTNRLWFRFPRSNIVFTWQRNILIFLYFSQSSLIVNLCFPCFERKLVLNLMWNVLSLLKDSINAFIFI